MYTLERNRIYSLAQPVTAEFSKGTSSISATWLVSTAGILSTADQKIADKSGNINRVLGIYDADNTVRLHETNDNGASWYTIFERASQIDSFGADADLYDDYIVIGVPTFRNGTGKIESWYLDNEISAYTLNTPYSGWNMVTYTNDDTYDGLTGTNTLSSDVGLGFNVSITPSFWTPSLSLSAIAAWYDASDASTITEGVSGVSQWNDKSSNGYHLTQTTPTQQPATGTRSINSLNVLEFDSGLSAEMTNLTSDVLSNNEGMIFAVWSSDEDTGFFQGIVGKDTTDVTKQNKISYSGDDSSLSYDLGNGLTSKGVGTLGGAGRMFAGTWEYDGSTETDLSLFDDGSFIWSNTLSGQIDSSVNNIIVGKDTVETTAFLSGVIAEIIVTNTNDVTTRQQIEGYLANKWGLRSSLQSTHPYKLSIPASGDPVVIASTSGDNLDYTSLDVFEYNRLYKGNLQVRRFVSTQKVKMVETNHKVKILETGDDNKYNIYDPVNGFNIGLIYPSIDFLQSNASGNPKLNQNILGDVKTQAPDGALDQVTQLNNTAITFKEETTDNIKYYSFVDGEYQELPNGAVLYNEPTTFDEDYINSLSAPKVVLSGMEYGYFGEMPINDVAYDFDYGELYVDMFNLHNELDYKYDTDAYHDPSETVPNTTDVFLNNTRDYERIGVNENIIWVSYRVGQNYQGSIGVSPLPDGYSYDNEAPVLMSKTTQTTGTAFDYAYIERFAGANRTSTTAHKSNIYSIEIINSNLNTNIEDEDTRNYIQTIVERAILQFQENVAPIHTQLWKIIWKGL